MERTLETDPSNGLVAKHSKHVAHEREAKGFHAFEAEALGVVGVEMTQFRLLFEFVRCSGCGRVVQSMQANRL